MGASDANGVGSSVPCFYEECPDGMGYVPVAARTLRNLGYSVVLKNRGLPEAVISRRIQTLGQQYINGDFLFNFIEDEAPFLPKDSTVVTIFAGGNDTNVVRAAIDGGAAGGDRDSYVEQHIQLFSTDFDSLLNGIYARAPSTRIVVLNLPNLAVLPYFASSPLATRQAAQRFAVGVTTRVLNTMTSRGMPVIDLMCDSRSYQSSSLSSDGFHPNDAGYAWMAAEVVTAITSASYAQPRSSCAQMSLVQ